jgi:hypothetical protein
MNAISISIIAIVIAAMLAAIAPVTRYTEHEVATLSARAGSVRSHAQIDEGSGLSA